jgi:hypothetical protein
MAIVPTWLDRPPSSTSPTWQPPSLPSGLPLSLPGGIDVMLRERDAYRAALIAIEQKLAEIVSRQPVRYKHAFLAFRDAGGATAEQWKEWVQHMRANDAQPALRYQRLKLVQPVG